MDLIHKNKKYITAGVLLLITVLIFWPKNKEVVTKVEQLNNQVNNLVIPKPPIAFETPNKIEWSLSQIMGEKVNQVLSTKRTAVSEIQNKNFTELMGLNYNNRQLNSGLISINESTGRKHVNIYLNSSSLEYGENIDDKSQIDNSTKKNVDLLKNNLSDLLDKILGSNSYRIDNIAYKQFVYPRWVSSGEAKADTVEIEANYLINNIPLLTFTGSPIKATYTMGGRLVKLQIQLPPKVTSKIKIEKVIDLDTVKAAPMKSFYIYKIMADKAYELEAVQEKIGTVSITSGHTAYVYDSNSNVTAPYFILEGNSELETGAAKVILITPAIDVK